MELDAAHDTEGDGRDDATIARMSSADADSGSASTVVNPITPTVPGTRCLPPGSRELVEDGDHELPEALDGRDADALVR